MMTVFFSEFFLRDKIRQYSGVPLKKGKIYIPTNYILYYFEIL